MQPPPVNVSSIQKHPSSHRFNFLSHCGNKQFGDVRILHCMFTEAFCEEYRVLQDGKCSVLTNFALDKRNLLKVNQAIYPLA